MGFRSLLGKIAIWRGLSVPLRYKVLITIYESSGHAVREGRRYKGHGRILLVLITR